jgi:hypothetical protein
MTLRVAALDGLDLRLGREPWAFAEASRAAIEAHWRDMVAKHPYLWNGDVLISVAAEVRDNILVGRFARTDYASFVAWRDWGWPDRGARNCFGVPALVTSDGALVYGIMGEATLNGGLCYPPSGSLEMRDVEADGVIDIRRSIRIEVAEETGLDIGKARSGRLVAIFDAQRLAVVESLWLEHDFAWVAAQFAAHRAADPDPELAAIVAIRSSSQIDATMPPYAQEIVRLFERDGMIR